MRRSASRLLSLLIAFALLALPVILLTGCAEFGALSEFFFPSGTASTTGAQTSPVRPEGELTLRYDQRIDIAGVFLSLENVSTADASLLTLVSEEESGDSFRLRACGTGSATLVYRIGDTEYRTPVRVLPAPISLFLILGEADALGSDAPASYPVKAEEGLVYHTVPRLTSGTPLSTLNAADYVVESLTENTYGQNTHKLVCPTDNLTAAGEALYASFSSALAYKWAEQTEERVWIVNTAERGSTISDWSPQPGVTVENYSGGAGGAYYRTVALFREVCHTLHREISAGHYTLSRIGYIFCQGESDAAQSAAYYLSALTQMYNGFREDLSVRIDGADYSLDFGSLIACRADRSAGSTGVRMNGPRCAQYSIANATSESLSDFYMLSNVTDSWYSDASVADYFSRYDSRNYRMFYGYLPPSRLSELIAPDGLYTEAALNEIGTDAAENLLFLLGERENTGTASVRLVGSDGIESVTDALRAPYGADTVSVVPVVSPLRLSKRCAPSLRLSTDAVSSSEYTFENFRIGEQIRLQFSASLPGDDPLSLDLLLPVLYDKTFAFTDSLPAVTVTDGRYAFHGFTGYWRCGYTDQDSGAFSPYTTIDSRYGWLYDGNGIWNGYGGISAADGWCFGPVATWDSAFAFDVPESGTVRIDFNAITLPQNDYLFAIFRNGEMVFPTAGAAPANNSAFFTVHTTDTLDSIRDAVADLRISVEEGDTLTFVCRRSNSNLTAEGGILPVVRYEDVLPASAP